MKDIFTRLCSKLGIQRVANKASLTSDHLSIQSFSKNSYKYGKACTPAPEIVVLLAAITEERLSAIRATTKVVESIGRIRVHMKELEKKLSMMLGDREHGRRDL